MEFYNRILSYISHAFKALPFLGGVGGGLLLLLGELGFYLPVAPTTL